MEFTHAAVAAYVASGMADVSFGVEAAARQFGLDFIRLLTEDYFFVCKRAFLETEPMRRVIDIMKGREFQRGGREPARLRRDQHRHGQYRQGVSGERGIERHLMFRRAPFTSSAFRLRRFRSDMIASAFGVREVSMATDRICARMSRW